MTTKKKTSKVVSPDLLAQREYTETLRSNGFDFSLMVAGAFVRGIRDIGYKSTATALDEFVDNSLQAGAENIHVVFGYSGKSNQPAQLAIIDDAHGMDPDMIRAAILWGGTHRENDRTGFGRYGYGLPSAAVSQGKRFEIYSIVDGRELYKGWLDIDELEKGKYTNSNGKIIVPLPEVVSLPNWVDGYINENSRAKVLDHGTVIILDKLDKLTWKTEKTLERNLLEHFGVVYRNFLRQVNIFVNGSKVEPVDPLFTTPGYRYCDLDDDRAESLEPISLDVRDAKSGNPLGRITVRFSYMPPTFARIPEDKLKEKGRTNARFPIMKEHNGIIILREGRQIDVITSRCPWTTFINYDRYWGVEVDFPATLDEEFSITTSKQQVVLSDRIWENLKQAGVYKAIQELRSRFEKENDELKRIREEGKTRKRASEEVMEDAEKFKVKPTEISAEKLVERKKAFDEEVRKRAGLTKRSVEDVEKDYLIEIQGHLYKVEFEAHPGAPFFRVAQIGGQEVLYINADHRFYRDLYMGPESTPRLRAALEVMLFVIGDGEVEASGDRKLFYQTERSEWSKRLSIALDRLEQHIRVEKDINDEETVLETSQN